MKKLDDSCESKVRAFSDMKALIEVSNKYVYKSIVDAA